MNIIKNARTLIVHCLCYNYIDYIVANYFPQLIRN